MVDRSPFECEKIIALRREHDMAVPDAVTPSQGYRRGGTRAPKAGSKLSHSILDALKGRLRQETHRFEFIADQTILKLLGFAVAMATLLLGVAFSIAWLIRQISGG